VPLKLPCQCTFAWATLSGSVCFGLLAADDSLSLVFVGAAPSVFVHQIAFLIGRGWRISGGSRSLACSGLAKVFRNCNVNVLGSRIGPQSCSGVITRKRWVSSCPHCWHLL